MKIRLAQKNDLPELKILFSSIVKNMWQNGIQIWNEFYPYEEFERDVVKQELYVIELKQNLIGAFVVSATINGQESFEWTDNSAVAVYLERLGIHPDFTKKGIASLVLDKIFKIAREKGALFIRLTVADVNLPAISFYKKNAFKQVNGIFNEFSPSLKKTICEWGFEHKV